MPDSGRRLWPAAAIAALISGLLATTAYGAVITGTPGNDRIRGKAEADQHQRPRRATTACSRGAGTTPWTSVPATIAASAAAATTPSAGSPATTSSGATRATTRCAATLDDVGDLVSQDRLHGGRGNDTALRRRRPRPAVGLARQRRARRRARRRTGSSPARATTPSPAARANDFQSGGFGDDTPGRRRRRRHDLRQQGPRHDRGRRRQRPAVRALAQGRGRAGRHRGRHRPRRHRRRPDRRPRRRARRRQLRPGHRQGAARLQGRRRGRLLRGRLARAPRTARTRASRTATRAIET